LFTSLSWVVPTSLCIELTSTFIQIFSSAIGVSRWQLVVTMKMSRRYALHLHSSCNWHEHNG